MNIRKTLTRGAESVLLILAFIAFATQSASAQNRTWFIGNVVGWLGNDSLRADLSVGPLVVGAVGDDSLGSFAGFQYFSGFYDSLLAVGRFANVELPKSFMLHPNYPNPFNPATSIRFDLPRPCYVDLRVFDLAGRLVGTLVSGVKEPGYHTVVWVTDAASGVYFYRLQAGDYVATRRMLLLK